MEIKIGMYARIENEIVLIEDIYQNEPYNAWSWSTMTEWNTKYDTPRDGWQVSITTNKKNEYGHSIHYRIDNINKVANTPQELIEVGDLIKFKSHRYLRKTSIVSVQKQYLGDKHIMTEFIDWLDYKDILSILTPNSKGGYDLQWEAK